MEQQTINPNRLATYGTLAPGRINHHQLEALSGTWSQGTVNGHLREDGWGSALGYPGLTLDREGTEIEVFILESDDLPDHWRRLDDFEGSGYKRIITSANTTTGTLDVQIYVLSADKSEPEK